MVDELSRIRNFSIIAHIDHGKSTLADRFLQLTEAVSKRDFKDQFLDSHFIERERGITIKAKAVRLNYSIGGEKYTLNLIDTPGHVDFSYEVSKSLSSCEGAILLVDASQGVQAQTISNFYLALDNNITIIPVVNKIDLPTARVSETIDELTHLFGINKSDVLAISAKTGEGTQKLLEEVIHRIPPPTGNRNSPLRALIFDSVYDDYKGVIIYVRVFNGSVNEGDRILLLKKGVELKVEELGVYNPFFERRSSINAGEVGVIITGLRDIHSIRVGDTVISAELYQKSLSGKIDEKNATELTPIAGYKEVKPLVFCSFFPANEYDFESLKKAIEKLSLTDAAFKYEVESSSTLGMGIRCGFLGLLHMDIIRERVEREANIGVIQTVPNIPFKVILKGKDSGNPVEEIFDSPAKLVDEENIIEYQELYTLTTIITPSEYIGRIIELCKDRRGEFVKMEYISQDRVIITYNLPFTEIINNFFDKLKSITHGYGTMDYTITGYRSSDLVKLRILVGGKEVDAFSLIIHRSKAEKKGREIISTLRKNIPRQLFEIPLQAAIGKRIIARETIKPIYKFVTGKCYGGDITRKRKLWEKQKEGKKRMKMRSIGQVEVPQEAFLAVIKTISE